MIHSGCPPNIWSFCYELAGKDGIAMKGHCVIIHFMLQKEILLKNLYSAHQETEKTNLRARTSVYWRGLNKNVEPKIALVSMNYLKCTNATNIIIITNYRNLYYKEFSCNMLQFTTDAYSLA